MAASLYLKVPLRGPDAPLPAALAAVLDGAGFACLRLCCGNEPVAVIQARASELAVLAEQRDLPVVIDDHFRLVQSLGLDGVHLTDGSRHMRDARKVLGQQAIVGAFCGNSRHAGMSAAEATADYVAFGPLTPDPLLGDGSMAEPDLFAWWSQMIEVPVVAEGGLTPAIARTLAETADFLCLGDEIWLDPPGPETALRAFLAALR